MGLCCIWERKLTKIKGFPPSRVLIKKPSTKYFVYNKLLYAITPLQLNQTLWHQNNTRINKLYRWLSDACFFFVQIFFAKINETQFFFGQKFRKLWRIKIFAAKVFFRSRRVFAGTQPRRRRRRTPAPRPAQPRNISVPRRIIVVGLFIVKLWLWCCLP